MAEVGPLLVPISFEAVCWLRCWLAWWIWWHIFFLRDFSALEIEQCIHSGFTVPQDATEFPSSSVSSTDNFSERNGVTGEFGVVSLAYDRLRAVS